MGKLTNKTRKKKVGSVKKSVLFVGLIATVFILSYDCYSFNDGDWQLWNTDGIEIKLNDRWKIGVEEELRFGDNISEIYYTYTDGGLDLKVTDGLHFGLNYRQVYEKKEDEWKEENRPHANATVKWKLYDLDLSNRSRLEYRMRENKDDEWRYRDKLTVKFPWKWTDYKIQPYVADEIFLDFYGEKINRNRLYAGLTSKIFRHLNVDVFYLWQASKAKVDKWTDYNVMGIKAKVLF